LDLENSKAKNEGFSLKIPELLAQRKFVSAAGYAHTVALKAPKTVAQFYC